MNVTVDGLALVCAMCPALADAGVPGGLVIAVAEPPVCGNVKTVPEGAIVFTVEGTTYYQFENVFFNQKPGGGYAIVAEPSSS